MTAHGQPGRPSYPHVHQVNVSDGGIPKYPVPEAMVGFNGLSGDQQHNRKLHGGPERAVCIYSHDLIERLQNEGHVIEAGSSGENLTLRGLAWEKLCPGSRLRVGPEVYLEISSYCEPCKLNSRWFHDGDITRILQETNPGWSRLYARVLAGGVVRPGDAVELEEPAHESVSECFGKAVR
ncbi:sulfurase [Nitrospira sp. KM1]|uniref:MOSC domain-containing protein n=1 Tax=Nitrospira sp. KM1 TaxID=1936990 RepID=UPI0013A75E23|nr:MOSC domain-containing protein [Nitrospira sp. KM1]BCA56301.1 sulfurase [Nitrospira sp. KM1]